jgi:O-methyltransferase
MLPTQFLPSAEMARRLLAATGYYRFRTWLASRGASVPGASLYQPLYAPWLGLPAFEEHYQAIRKLTMVSRDRAHILWRTLQQALRLPGDLVECGVFRGGTALLAARTVAATRGETNRPLHLFDSFQGVSSEVKGEESFLPGHFGDTSAAKVQALLADYPSVRMHVGYIPQTFQGLNIESVVWAHVDLDLYHPIRAAIDYLYPRIVPGGFLIFDDYGFPSCPGARQAVDDAFADRPEVPLCLPTGQCLVVKLGSGEACKP